MPRQSMGMLRLALITLAAIAILAPGCRKGAKRSSPKRPATFGLRLGDRVADLTRRFAPLAGKGRWASARPGVHVYRCRDRCAGVPWTAIVRARAGRITRMRFLFTTAGLRGGGIARPRLVAYLRQRLARGKRLGQGPLLERAVATRTQLTVLDERGVDGSLSFELIDRKEEPVHAQALIAALGPRAGGAKAGPFHAVHLHRGGLYRFARLRYEDPLAGVRVVRLPGGQTRLLPRSRTVPCALCPGLLVTARLRSGRRPEAAVILSRAGQRVRLRIARTGERTALHVSRVSLPTLLLGGCARIASHCPAELTPGPAGPTLSKGRALLHCTPGRAPCRFGRLAAGAVWPAEKGKRLGLKRGDKVEMIDAADLRACRPAVGALVFAGQTHRGQDRHAVVLGQKGATIVLRSAATGRVIQRSLDSLTVPRRYSAAACAGRSSP